MRSRRDTRLVRRSVLTAGLVALAAVVASDRTVLAQAEEDSISDRINDQLERRIESIRDNLKDEVIKGEHESRRQENLLDEIRALDKRLLASSRRSEEMLVEQQQLLEESTKLSAELERLDAERARTEDKLIERLTSIYKLGRLGSSRVMLKAAASAEPIRMARYLAAISQADRASLARYEVVRRDREQALTQMATKTRSIEEAKEKMATAEVNYASTRDEKVALLARVEGDIAVRKEQMTKLKNAEDELRKILAEAPPTEQSGPVRLTRVYKPRTGPFKTLKGNLAAPLSGVVVGRFGDDSRTRVPARGIRVRPRSDGRVFSVAPGEVVFAGPFPGLGNTVILNHGERYHTVYAQLDEIEPEVGGYLGDKGLVGVLGGPDSMLHFELRAQGKAIDPLAWFEGGELAFSR